MAQQYGGRFSPDGQTRDHRGGDQRPPPAAPARARHRLESRTKWITIAGIPFLLGAFWQDPTGMVANLLGFGGLAAGMWMTREGLQAEAAYDARRSARRPAIPRKLFGGVLTGLGLAVGAWAPDALAGAATIGIAGAALHLLAFGADPMRDKGMEGVDTFQQDRVARMVAEGQGYLDGMKDAILRTGERRLEARVNMFEATAHGLFDQVEQNPNHLTAVRRYLGVYLMGARDATVKFVDLYRQTRDPRALADWEALLNDLETNFAARSRALMEGGRTDMDIEISVLRDRLAREGIRPDVAALESRDDPGFAEWLRDLDKDKAPR
ncbi:MAG: 5-bromo-4-chloroindolyl phosphate hydrolysis family protein [Paracoccus sp. (in: a-proteobacteria)]|nr:5-bromo-4-chloroindolyl phosphate hydrolysis family protein [Paracoccus sp. (in: a-proteobacteria)]